VPALPAPQRPVVSEPPAIGERRLRLALPTQVARLQAIFPVPNRQSKDTYALYLLSNALAEGKLSRLYRRLVEGDRTAADVDSFAMINRDLGQFVVTANAADDASIEVLESGMWQELERVARQPLTAAELERAKNQFTAEWVQGVETSNELATVLGEADALGGHEYLDTLLARVQAVTATDVQRVARTYFRRDRATVGHLLPQAARSAAGSSGSRIASRMEGMLRAPRALRGPAAKANAPAPAAPLVTVTPTASTFKPLKPVEKVLPNGMRLVLLEQHALPSVVLSTRVDAGSYHETDATSGLARMVARMLEEGTATRSHAQISAALEQVGASLEASAGGVSSYLELHSLSRHVTDLLPLYAELLRAPRFPADRLEQERSRALVELREEEDDAPTVASRAFYDLVYGSHPAHRPVSGTLKTLQALEPEALQAFHERWYRPERVTLVAVGDFNTATLMARLTELFGGWERGTAAAQVTLPPVQRQTERRSRRITMDKTQTQIVLGHLGVRRLDADYAALRVMDTILGEGVGGGFTARIPYQLRDVQGLAYGVGSSITRSAGMEPGVFAAHIGTEPAKEKAAVAALLREIGRIRTAPVTATELKEATAYLANSYVFNFQTNEQLADYLHAVQYYGLGYDYRRRFVQEVQRVTQQDVLRVARKHLDPNRYTLVVVGPGPGPRK